MKEHIQTSNRNMPIRRQHGFSLASTMVGLLVVGGVGVGGTYVYKDYRQDEVSQARGQQIGTARAQLEAFARKYQANLTAKQAISGIANTAAPTTAELSNLGFAATSFSDAAQPGGAITYRIWLEPTGCAAAKCVLGLAAITSGSVRNTNGDVDLAFAQRIAGYVPLGAGWSTVPTNGALLVKKGIIFNNPLGNVPAAVAAMSWLGNSTASQTVPPAYYEYRSAGCPSGYDGSKEQRRTMTTDKWGTVTAGGWVTYENDCTATPPPTPPTCANGASDYPTCTPPYTPPATTTPVSTPPASTTPVSTAPVSTPPASTTPVSNPTCSNGASNYPTCTPPTCSNGASDYPTCTPPYTPPPVAPPPPPPPAACTTTYAWSIPTGSGVHKCSQTTTTCCSGTCTKQTDYGTTAGYSGVCELN